MSVEQELKTLILNQYKSIRAFALELKIPYSTIDTMLKRGISGTAVSTVLKICNALDIDADSLSHGAIQPKNHMPTQSLISSNELDTIKKYRTLDAYGKKNVDNVLNNEYERCKDSKAIPLQESPDPYKIHTIAAHVRPDATEEDKLYDYELAQQIIATKGNIKGVHRE